MFQTRTDDQLRWYCLHTKPKCEHIASAHLAHLEGVEVFCPRIRFQKKTRRGKVWFNEALFPGYTFARFRIADRLRAVNSAQAVLRVIRFGDNAYASVPDLVIQDWQAAVDDRTLITIEEQFRPGDEVEIVEGPMRGIRTIITQQTIKARATKDVVIPITTQRRISTSKQANGVIASCAAKGIIANGRGHESSPEKDEAYVRWAGCHWHMPKGTCARLCVEQNLTVNGDVTD